MSMSKSSAPLAFEENSTTITFIPDVSGQAALTVCESLLLALSGCKTLPEKESLGVLKDVASTHRNAAESGENSDLNNAARSLWLTAPFCGNILQSFKKGEDVMAKFANSVRFRVKPGKVEDFRAAFESLELFDGMELHRLVQTGDREFVSFGEWESEEKLVAARADMIGFLDTIRDMLEEMSPELGVTDPVSGPVVMSH